MQIRALALNLLVVALLLTACGDGDGGLSDPIPGGEHPEGSPQLQGLADSPPAATQVPEPAPTPAVDPALMLPDLIPTPPKELYIKQVAGRRQIRFSTTIENIGDGPVRLVGVLDASGGSATATQVVERRGDKPWNRVIGKMQHDRQHGHWHLNDFAAFELWTYGPGGTLETMLASTPKITFCLLDMFPVDPAPVYAADRAEFTQCNWRAQGISEGWSEVYKADLPGQGLDIGSLPDGTYALRTTLDPLGQILEKDTSNNTSTVFVQVTGSRIQQITLPTPTPPYEP